MGLLAALRREFLYLTELPRLKRKLAWNTPDSEVLTPDHLEEVVDRHRDLPAFITDEGEVSYANYDEYASRVANWALAQGLKAGDSVALFAPNRWEYIAIWVGLTKAGVIPALINNQLAGQPLAHCLNLAGAAHAIVDAELGEAYLGARALLGNGVTAWALGGRFDGAEDFDAALAGVSGDRPDRSHRAHLRAKDPCLMMYTSGTTGLPKAAIVAHTRTIYYLNIFSTAVRAGPGDRMIMVLPLYHSTGGLCGVGCGISHGGALIVRKKFTASGFWDEAERFGATLFMYVGELCRFLLSAPETEAETRHTIRCMIGNGLRPDIWERFQERFNVPRILEFYGATEGNVGLANLDSKPGAIGRIPPYLESQFNVRLVKFDLVAEVPVRGPDGRCIRAEPGEVGEAIGEIKSDDSRFRFEGYKDKAETEKKILRDVFKPGDAWFRTGDLMRRDKHGYFYFIDRIGDTFRWKSENVSTNEVAEALGAFPGVDQANVYGVAVQGYPGKAGMAALVVAEDFDMAGLHAHVHASLPRYARPLFLRIQSETDTTGTFKFRKVDLVKQGFDPEIVNDPVWFDHPAESRYVRLDGPLYKAIQAGEINV